MLNKVLDFDWKKKKCFSNIGATPEKYSVDPIYYILSFANNLKAHSTILLIIIYEACYYGLKVDKDFYQHKEMSKPVNYLGL